MDTETPKRTYKEIADRRVDILNYIKVAGPYNFPKETFCEKYQVSRYTIEKDIKLILKKQTLPIIEEESKKLLLVYTKALEKANELMMENETKAQGISLLLTASEKYTKFLEDFGLKNKIAEQLSIEITEDAKKLYTKKLEDFSKLNKLPKEQQEIIKKIIFGEDGTNIQQPQDN